MQRTIGQSFLGDYHSSRMKKRKPERTSDPAYFLTCKNIIHLLHSVSNNDVCLVCLFSLHPDIYLSLKPSHQECQRLFMCVCVCCSELNKQIDIWLVKVIYSKTLLIHMGRVTMATSLATSLHYLSLDTPV